MFGGENKSSPKVLFWGYLVCVLVLSVSLVMINLIRLVEGWGIPFYVIVATLTIVMISGIRSMILSYRQIIKG